MQGQYVRDLHKSYQLVSSHTTGFKGWRHSLETNPKQRGGGWLLISLFCIMLFTCYGTTSLQEGQCKHLKTYYWKIFDGISREVHFQQYLVGGNRQARWR